MKTQLTGAITTALLVHLIINFLFFLISVMRPFDALLLTLFSLPAPIGLGLTAIFFFHRWETIVDVLGYKWLAGLGVVGGYVGVVLTGIASSSLTGGTSSLLESYVLRMIVLNISCIVGGTITQLALVSISQAWSRIRRKR